MCGYINSRYDDYKWMLALQKDGVAVDESGLPCDPTCKDPLVNNLKPNDNKLGVILPPKPV